VADKNPGGEHGREDRLTDRIGLGVLTRLVHRDLVDEVLAETGRTERRRRLPARVVVYFVLAMTLFFDDADEEVMHKDPRPSQPSQTPPHLPRRHQKSWPAQIPPKNPRPQQHQPQGTTRNLTQPPTSLRALPSEPGFLCVCHPWAGGRRVAIGGSGK
jgi:hypothetical protein